MIGFSKIRNKRVLLALSLSAAVIALLAVLADPTSWWTAKPAASGKQQVARTEPGEGKAVFGEKTGKSKPVVALTLEEALRHPIWMWALDEETVEGQDETWVKPVLDTTDVGENLVHYSPVITLKVVGTDLHGSASYYHPTRQLIGLVIWRDGRWIDAQDLADSAFPMVLEAVPTIRGKPGVLFRADSPGQTPNRID